MLDHHEQVRQIVPDSALWVDALLKGFSGPGAPFVEAEAQFLICSHGQMIVEQFLAREAATLAGCGDGLGSFLSEQLTAGLTFDDCWHWTAGALHAQAIGASAESAGPLAAALALHLCSLGRVGNWSILLDETRSFLIGDLFLPNVRQLSVDARADGVEILADGRSYRLGTGATFPPALASGPIQVSLIAQTQMPQDTAARLLHADAYSFAPGTSRLPQPWVDACDEALGLLNAASSRYAAWVGRVAQLLMPMPLLPNTINSGCERFSPGIIAMSATSNPWLVAEILVHEATHHYLHWISRAGDLDDGSDTREYYSPFRHKNRPIYFIVVAYHAFANVLLFYRDARAAGYSPPPGAGPFADREATLSAQLAQIEPVLHASTALTAIGENLWRPLYDQLRR